MPICVNAMSLQHDGSAEKKPNDPIYNNSSHSERELNVVFALIRADLVMECHTPYSTYASHQICQKRNKHKKIICEKAFPKINCDFTDSCFSFISSIPFFLVSSFPRWDAAISLMHDARNAMTWIKCELSNCQIYMSLRQRRKVCITVICARKRVTMARTLAHRKTRWVWESEVSNKNKKEQENTFHSYGKSTRLVENEEKEKERKR